MFPMIKTALLSFALFLSLSLTAQNEQYFFKTLDCYLANTLCFDRDSNIWVGAVRVNQPWLLKFDRNGILLDQVLLDIPYGNLNIPNQLLIDSDGMLVGCGVMSPTIPSQPESSFVFRFDLANRQLLWSRRLAHTFLFVNGIIEHEPGANFTLYGNNYDLRSAADVLQVDRNTGALVDSFNFSYKIGNEELVNAMVYHNGDWFVSGKNDVHFLNNNTVGEYDRQAIWRLDSTGTPVWALLGSVPDPQRARLTGQSLLIEQDTIVSLSYGDENLPVQGQATNRIFLQKTTLDGELVWIKKIDITDFGYQSEIGYNLISVQDGFIIFGRGSAFNSDFLLKTDKAGNILWTQRILSDAFDPFYSHAQSRLISDGKALFIASQIQEGTKLYGAFIKTDLNGNIAGCDRIQPLFAVEQPLHNPHFAQLDLERDNSGAISDTTIAELPVSEPLALETRCASQGVGPQDPCKPTTFFQKLGEPGDALRTTSMTATPAGNLILAGQQNGLAKLSALDANGAVLWSKNLNLAPGDSLSLLEVLIDSEGMLAGCGYIDNAAGERSGYVFRANPDSAQLQWATRIETIQPEDGGLVDIPGGNVYLFYHNLRLPDGRQVPETIMFDKTSGTVLSLSGRRYDYDFGDQVFGSIKANNFGLFAVGQNNRFARPRMALTRINADFGGLNWAQLSHSDTAALDFSGGYGAVGFEGNNVVTAYTGGSGTPGQASRLFLQKANAAGTIIWVRHFDIALQSELDMLTVPGGFVILGKTDQAEYVFLKTDLNGNLLIAKKFQPGTPATATPASEKTQGRIALLDNHLFFALFDDRPGVEVPYLLKTDLNLDVAGPCDLLKTFSPVSGNLTGPLATPFTEGVFVTPFGGTVIAPEAQGAELHTSQLCPPILVVPDLDLGPDLSICSNDMAVLSSNAMFETYLWQDGSTGPSITVTDPGIYILETATVCGVVQQDTVEVTVGPQPSQTEVLAVAPNFPVNLGGTDYFFPDTVTLTIPSGTGFCDTLQTYILSPCQPINSSQLITFYPGETVLINGTTYDQPGTYTVNYPIQYGCDSVVTYTLEWLITSLDVDCPADIADSIAPDQSSLVVQYDLPIATTDCPDSDLNFTLLSGLPPGSAFPLGITPVCYEVSNACGIRDTCCFQVNITLAKPPCDVKMAGTCLQIELLNIRLDSLGNRHYSIRLENTCPDAVDYLALQLPKGVTAEWPANGSTYTAPSGNGYLVRNPNFSPFYSIRYKALEDNLKNGASDIFEYTLPQQAQPGYIHVFVRLENRQSFETHLSALGCQPEPWNSFDRNSEQLSATIQGFDLWPNPVSNTLNFGAGNWMEQQVHLKIFNARGQMVYFENRNIATGIQQIRLGNDFAEGLYFLAVQGPNGKQEMARFVIVR